MKKTQNYVTGQWITGKGEGVPMFDAITGEVVALSDTEGLDFAEILHYGRTKGGEVLRKMTFQRPEQIVGLILKADSVIFLPMHL